MEPKGKATTHRENEEGKETMKPDGKEGLIPSKGESRGGDDPPATEIHTGEPQLLIIKHQGTTMGSEVRL